MLENCKQDSFTAVGRSSHLWRKEPQQVLLPGEAAGREGQALPSSTFTVSLHCPVLAGSTREQLATQKGVCRNSVLSYEVKLKAGCLEIKNSSFLSGRVLLREDVFERFAQDNILTAKPLVCDLLSAGYHIRIAQDLMPGIGLLQRLSH